MNISLTWADNALTLLLGVVGALVAAYLWARWPRWSSRALTYWAERSEKSARRLLKKLKQDPQIVRGFQSDPTRYIGWIVQKAVIILSLFFSVTVSFLALSFAWQRGMNDKLMLHLDPSYAGAMPPQEIKVVALIVTGALMVLMIMILRRQLEMLRYSDLDHRRA